MRTYDKIETVNELNMTSRYYNIYVTKYNRTLKQYDNIISNITKTNAQPRLPHLARKLDYLQSKITEIGNILESEYS